MYKYPHANNINNNNNNNSGNSGSSSSSSRSSNINKIIWSTRRVIARHSSRILTWWMPLPGKPGWFLCFETWCTINTTYDVHGCMVGRQNMSIALRWGRHGYKICPWLYGKAGMATKYVEGYTVRQGWLYYICSWLYGEAGTATKYAHGYTVRQACVVEKICPWLNGEIAIAGNYNLHVWMVEAAVG